MRHLATVLMCFYISTAFGQIEKGKPIWPDEPKTSENDSVPKVIYAKEHHHSGITAFFVNDQFLVGGNTPIFNPSIIGEVNVYKNPVQINEIKYDSQIRITTKDNYLPKFTSLNKLKAKYTNLGQQPAIFTIDDKIINSDYDEFMVDENYILRITVEKTDKVKGSNDLNFVKLLTRTPENIAKSKRIMIRGANLASSF